MGHIVRYENMDFSNPIAYNYIDNDDIFSDGGLCFNYANGMMYELCCDGMDCCNYLAEFDRTSGTVTNRELVADDSYWLTGFAISTDGVMYATDDNGTVLYKINSTTYELEYLFDLGFTTKEIEYNHNEGNLYAMSANNTLYRIDLASQSAVSIGTIPGHTYSDMFCIYDPQEVVHVPAEGITMIASELSLGFGQTTGEPVGASVLPSSASDRSVTYTSDDESIATVDENGYVTAKSVIGTTTVTATSNDGGFTASCIVRVSELGDLGDVLNVAGGTLKFYSLLELPYTPMEIGGRTVAMATNDLNQGTESWLWTYAQLEAGDVVSLDASFDIAYGAWCVVDIYARNISTDQVYEQLIYHNADQADMGWQTFNIEIGNAGNYFIYINFRILTMGCPGSIIYVDNVFAGSLPEITSIEMETNVEVGVLFHHRLDYQLFPSNADLLSNLYDLSFGSSDESVATVSQEGIVFGVGVGSAEITMTDNASGVSSSCTVSVSEIDCLRMYGFDEYTSAMLSFSDTDPNDYYTYSDALGDYEVSAAEYFNGYVYGYTTDRRFFSAPLDSMDSCTISEAAVSSLTGNSIIDISFNYADCNMYALVKTAESTYCVGVVDMTTGEIAYPMNNYFSSVHDIHAFAIDMNGIGYYMEEYESTYVALKSFDMASIYSGSTTIVTLYIMTNVLETLTYAQSMCFDHETGMLYYSFYSNGSINDSIGIRCGIIKIDLTGQTTEILNGGMVWYYQYPNDNMFPVYKLDGMFIPYDVPSPVMGDANCDGELNVTDALLILRYAIRLADLSEEGIMLADYNGDGVVDLTDALLVMRKAMNLE